ncbi:MAG TPA: NrsF family protein [Kofleriaceae bacterium]|jgi:hypothetical protein
MAKQDQTWPVEAERIALPTFVPPPPGDVLDAMIAEVVAVRARRPLRQFLLLGVASLLYSALVLLLVHPRKDMPGQELAWLVGAGIVWTMGFLVPTAFALIPRKGSVMPRWRFAAVASMVTAVAFVALGLAIHPSVPGVSLHYGTERFVHGHFCLEIGLATALVPVALGALCLRGAIPVGSRWVAAALGAGGGGLGGLVLHLHCHVTDPLHQGVVHGGVVVVSALLSALIVPRAAA